MLTSWVIIPLGWFLFVSILATVATMLLGRVAARSTARRQRNRRHGFDS